MFGMFLMLYIGIGIVASLIGVGLLHNVDSLFGDTMTAYELERARTMMWLLVANLAITFPMSIFGSIITAYERFVFAKGLNIARLVLNTAVMIALLSFGYKAVAMVVVQTIFNIATLIINLLYCKYRLKIKIILGKIRWELLREVAIYSFWIFINIIIDRIYWSTGQFVLGAKVGTAAVAIFAVAIQLQQMYMAFSTAISGVFLPKVTAMVARGAHNKEISDIFIRVGRIQYIIISLLLYGFMVFGRAFIELWAGEEYSEAFVVTLLFFIGLTIPLIQNMGITILEARNQMRFRSLLYVGIAIISLSLQIALATKYGIVGCAIAITGALLLGHGLIMNIYYKSRQHIDILGFWLQIAKMSVAPIAVSIAASYLLCGQDIDSWSELLKYILIYLAAYLPMLYIFSLNTYERGLLKELFMNLKRIVSR
jgi:O-antigen/teichoic acid export membrane protein